MEKLIAIAGIKVDLINDGITIGNFNIGKESVYNAAYATFKILGIIILMLLAAKIGNSVIYKVVERQKKFKFSLDERKSETLKLVLQSILRYSIYFVGIFAIIEIMFGTVGLTLASIGGVAVGFGSQSLVKDMINGFFILFEDQYSVGDYIDIDDKSGIVESIELRITKIRDFNGDLHTIPNGTITKVTNHSRGDRRILVDVDISYDADQDKAMEAIGAVCSKFTSENEDVVEKPEILGIYALKDAGVTIRITGKTKSSAQLSLEMKLRKEIKDGLSEANIMPFPGVKILKE
jgi:small-conductance mechanosensitive channel